MELPSFEMHTIGRVRSCFSRKFGIPRQPSLAPGARAVLDIYPPYGAPECFRGIEGISHLWVLFQFHATTHQGWRSTVRPPRMGGDKRIGVFATRSNFRPNSIGLSAVKIENITFKNGHTLIEVSNHDLLDGTPILDIKPYIPFADAPPEATAYEPPESVLTVSIDPEVRDFIYAHIETPENYIALIHKLIASDPRPAYLAGKDDPDIYAIALDQHEFRFRIENANNACVFSVIPIKKQK